MTFQKKWFLCIYLDCFENTDISKYAPLACFPEDIWNLNLRLSPGFIACQSFHRIGKVNKNVYLIICHLKFTLLCIFSLTYAMNRILHKTWIPINLWMGDYRLGVFVSQYPSMTVSHVFRQFFPCIDHLKRYKLAKQLLLGLHLLSKVDHQVGNSLWSVL